MAFSRDGKRLLGASFQNTARLWDVASGRELLILKGHTGRVTCVAISQDGKRLATACVGSPAWGPDTRVWDASTGRELYRFGGRNRGLPFVAFSPDGKQLATAGESHQTIDVWDLTVPPLARKRWESQLLVERLFHEHLWRNEVIERLRSDTTSDEAVRTLALQISRTYPENPDRFNQVSRDVVKWPGASKDDYRMALRRAEVACRIAPDNEAYCSTLGMAFYRLGDYVKAGETLLRANKLYASKHPEASDASHPRDLAFLALAHHQLGQGNLARATLERLRKAMKETEWVTDTDARLFFLEATALIEAAKR